MTFHSIVKGVWPFDGSLSDLVSMNDFSGVSASEYQAWKRYDLSLNRSVNMSGLKFTQGYATDQVFLLNNSFAIAFWYYSPEALGFTEHASGTGEAPRQSPVLAIGQQNSVGLSVVAMQMTVTEIAVTNDTNAILFRFSSNGTLLNYQAISESYLPGIHYVVVSFNLQTGRMRVDLDGRAGISVVGPTTLSGPTGFPIYLNRVVVDYDSHVVTQSDAFISDLVILDTSAPLNLGLTSIRYGLDAVTDATKLLENYAYFGVGYPQESTVTTTGIFTQGENVFVSRSNGQVLKGVTPIWDRQVDFQSEDDLDAFTLSPVGETTLNGSKLTIQATTIKV